METDDDFVIVDNINGLVIELKEEKSAAVPEVAKQEEPTPISTTTKEEKPAPAPAPTATKEEEKLRVKQALNFAWLNADLGKFPAKTHARKVAKELQAQSGIIYLPGQEEKLYEDSDMGPPFRQRRHFYYITGADFPGCAVTYDIGRDSLILWIPLTDPRAVLWYGRTPTVEQTKAASDVDDVRYVVGLSDFLSKVLSHGSTLYVLKPTQMPPIGNTTNIFRIDTTKLAPAIERARVVKTDYEVAMIRRANAVSSAAHKAVMQRLTRASNERELEAIFLAFCISQGARNQAYQVIAASGVNGSTLHYIGNNEPLAGRQLVVLDAGAEWNCYASDVTRTYPVVGKFTTPQAANIYRLVSVMQSECIRRVRPGLPFYELHLLACKTAVDGLLRLGILRGGSEAEIMRAGTVAAFFPHGLGHHVGLEVHDVTGARPLLFPTAAAAASTAAAAVGPPPPRLRVQSAGGWMGARADLPVGRMPPKRQWVTPEMVSELFVDNHVVDLPLAGMFREEHARATARMKARQKLEPNMVVTIEPGIYFCREYIESYFLTNPTHSKYINTEVLQKYWDVGGVRIEDDILVTKNGYENLTSAPKGDEMLKVVNEGCK